MHHLKAAIHSANNTTYNLWALWLIQMIIQISMQSSGHPQSMVYPYHPHHHNVVRTLGHCCIIWEIMHSRTVTQITCSFPEHMARGLRKHEKRRQLRGLNVDRHDFFIPIQFNCSNKKTNNNKRRKTTLHYWWGYTISSARIPFMPFSYNLISQFNPASW